MERAGSLRKRTNVWQMPVLSRSESTSSPSKIAFERKKLSVRSENKTLTGPTRATITSTPQSSSSLSQLATGLTQKLPGKENELPSIFYDHTGKIRATISRTTSKRKKSSDPTKFTVNSEKNIIKRRLSGEYDYQLSSIKSCRGEPKNFLPKVVGSLEANIDKRDDITPRFSVYDDGKNGDTSPFRPRKAAGHRDPAEAITNKNAKKEKENIELVKRARVHGMIRSVEERRSCGAFPEANIVALENFRATTRDDSLLSHETLVNDGKEEAADKTTEKLNANEAKSMILSDASTSCYNIRETDPSRAVPRDLYFLWKSYQRYKSRQSGNRTEPISDLPDCEMKMKTDMSPGMRVRRTEGTKLFDTQSSPVQGISGVEFRIERVDCDGGCDGGRTPAMNNRRKVKSGSDIGRLNVPLSRGDDISPLKRRINKFKKSAMILGRKDGIAKVATAAAVTGPVTAADKRNVSDSEMGLQSLKVVSKLVRTTASCFNRTRKRKYHSQESTIDPATGAVMEITSLRTDPGVGETARNISTSGEARLPEVEYKISRRSPLNCKKSASPSVNESIVSLFRDQRDMSIPDDFKYLFATERDKSESLVKYRLSHSIKQQREPQRRNFSPERTVIDDTEPVLKTGKLIPKFCQPTLCDESSMLKDIFIEFVHDDPVDKHRDEPQRANNIFQNSQLYSLFPNSSIPAPEVAVIRVIEQQLANDEPPFTRCPRSEGDPSQHGCTALKSSDALDALTDCESCDREKGSFQEWHPCVARFENTSAPISSDDVPDNNTIRQIDPTLPAWVIKSFRYTAACPRIQALVKGRPASTTTTTGYYRSATITREADIAERIQYRSHYTDETIDLEQAREGCCYKISKTFLKGKVITPVQRRIVVNFLISVHVYLSTCSSTLYQAIKTFDSILDIKDVSVEELQLVALGALWIAVKNMETKIPTASKMISFAKDMYRTEGPKLLCKCERKILKTLGFNIRFPDPFYISAYYLEQWSTLGAVANEASIRKTIYRCACYLMDVALLDENYSGIPAELLAAAATRTAARLVLSTSWEPPVDHSLRIGEKMTGYTREEIECVAGPWLEGVLISAERNSPTGAVYKKYKTSTYDNTSDYLVHNIRRNILSKPKTPRPTIMLNVIEKYLWKSPVLFESCSKPVGTPQSCLKYCDKPDRQRENASLTRTLY